MSGHSKWSQIKHKKSASDQKRGQLFGKLGRAISIAARDGVEPASNQKLKALIDQARAVDMPNENIRRALSSGGNRPEEQFEELLLAALAPHGVALLMTAITDNKNRTLAELRQLLDAHEARLVPDASVLWMFTKRGAIHVPAAPNSEHRNRIELAAVESGAEDIEDDDTGVTFYTEPERLFSLRETLEQRGIQAEEADIVFVPAIPVSVSGKNKEQTTRLCETLEAHADVQRVFSNIA